MSIYLCDIGHDELCHEGPACPACEMRSDKDQEIVNLERKVSDLEDEVYTLRSESQSLRSEVNQ